MQLIDSLEKVYYCPLKKNRLVDDTGGAEKYKAVERLIWNESEIEKGKIIKINGFPANVKVKLFRVIVSTNKTEFVANNDIFKTPRTQYNRCAMSVGRLRSFIVNSNS